MTDLVGKEFLNYRITESIGSGGMAEVFLGEHKTLNKQVAIKVLHKYLLSGSDFVERFQREAQAVANLRHPNIVQVYDFVIQDDGIYMVMEYIEGTNLHDLMVSLASEGKRLPTDQIGSIIKGIASALDYAHSRGMLHRDIKPSNIMLDTSSGKAYLADFGLAKLISGQKFTATGTLLGTPAYMSPEQGRGEELTEQSDLYSLGIVAFEMLTGHLPFDSETPIGFIHQQISAPIPSIRDFIDDAPGSVQEAINRALAKQPDDRFGTADELVKAFRFTLDSIEIVKPVSWAHPLCPMRNWRFPQNLPRWSKK